MLSQDIKNKIQQLWNMFWSRGITNPITAIEQISYLLFLRRLEKIDEYDEVSIASRDNIFHGHEQCLWSNFSNLDPERMLECYKEEVFPFIKTLGSDNEPFALYMHDAVNEIGTASLLYDAVGIINSIYADIERNKERGEQLQDVQGDIYEYLINELSTSGKNGQFRTPRHIIKFICDIIDPDINDTICDPTCGTAGFLLGAYQRILTKYTPQGKLVNDENGLESYLHSSDAILSAEQREILSTSSFYGFDVDRTMVRISLMNMMLHGIYRPNIENIDTLSQSFVQRYGSNKFTVIVANPPFTGTISLDDLSADLKDYGKKSEYLFIVRILEMLQIGGRAAIIVPEGVLFSKGKNARNVRKKLLRDCDLISVISLPPGVFKPYAGVKTSILFFKKMEDNSTIWHTDDIWCYELKNDGYSLDDNRRKLQENPLPIAERMFRERDTHSEKTNQFFHLSIEELIENDFDLRFDLYRKDEDDVVEVKPPHELMEAIIKLEGEIMADLKNFNNMI